METSEIRAEIQKAVKILNRSYDGRSIKRQLLDFIDINYSSANTEEKQAVVIIVQLATVDTIPVIEELHF